MLKLALSVILRAVAAQQAKQAAVRGVMCVAGGILIAIFLFAAIGCLLAALWIYVDGAVGPVAAPAITALALLILAGLVALLLRLSRARKKRPAANADAFPDLSALTGLFREHTGTILAGAVILGLLTGSSRRRR